MKFITVQEAVETTSGSASRKTSRPPHRRRHQVLGLHARMNHYVAAATAGCSSWFLARLVSIAIRSVTVQRPRASGRTCQWGWTTTDWWTNSKPLSDWLTVWTGYVQKFVGQEAFKRDVDSQPLVHQAQAVDVRQVQPRAEIADRVAIGIAEVAVVDPAGHAGEVQLDREMRRAVPRQTVQKIDDLQRRAAGIERQALGDPQGLAVGSARSRKLNLDAVGVAPHPGVVRAVDEIAVLGRFARGDGLERNLVVMEPVQEALARMGVVLEHPVEALLLEDDAIVDTGDVAVVAARPGQDLAVIGFRPAGESGQQVVADRANVQLVQLAAAAGGDHGDELVVGQANFLPAVEVEIVGHGLDPVLRTALEPVEQIVGGDQAVVNGVAEVGQIDPAERAVPVGAIALAAVKLGPRGLQQLLVQRLVPVGGLDSLDPAAEEHHPRVHLVGLGILHLEVPPEAAADEPRSPGQRGSFSISWTSRSYSVSRSAGIAHSVISR